MDAKTQINVPKDLVLMKIAQQQMEKHKNNFVSERKRSMAAPQESSMLTGVSKRRMSLPPV